MTGVWRGHQKRNPGDGLQGGAHLALSGASTVEGKSQLEVQLSSVKDHWLIYCDGEMEGMHFTTTQLIGKLHLPVPSPAVPLLQSSRFPGSRPHKGKEQQARAGHKGTGRLNLPC